MITLYKPNQIWLVLTKRLIDAAVGILFAFYYFESFNNIDNFT